MPGRSRVGDERGVRRRSRVEPDRDERYDDERDDEDATGHDETYDGADESYDGDQYFEDGQYFEDERDHGDGDPAAEPGHRDRTDAGRRGQRPRARRTSPEALSAGLAARA